MSWRDKLQPGSFNGIAFYVQRSSFTFGRRKVIHEYPLRDDVYAEDMGRKARLFTLEAFVIGSNYMGQRDALIGQLEDIGKGILIHPYYGRLEVDVLDNCSCEESTSEGGWAKISVPVVESGKKLFPTEYEDTTARTLFDIDAARRAAAAQFAADFKMRDKPAFIFASALAFLSKGLNALRSINGKLSALLNPFNEAAQMLADIQGELTTLINSPLALATSIGNVCLTLMNTGRAVDTALAAYKRVHSDMQNTPPVIVNTPAKQQQADNQRAMQNLISTQILLGVLSSVTTASQAENARIEDSPFNSYQHAIALRNALLTALDEQAQNANDDTYNALLSVSSSFTRHMDRHGVNLRRVVSYSPKAVLPALVIAHRLYGDAQRDIDIITRNNLPEPGFVSAQALEVLDA